MHLKQLINFVCIYLDTQSILPGADTDWHWHGNVQKNNACNASLRVDKVVGYNIIAPGPQTMHVQCNCPIVSEDNLLIMEHKG